jgi:hypothetical protein
LGSLSISAYTALPFKSKHKTQTYHSESTIRPAATIPGDVDESERTSIGIRPARLETTMWLPFLDTYRTMCRVPEPAFRRILESVRELGFSAITRMDSPAM